MTTPNIEELRKLAEDLRDAELAHPKWLAKCAFNVAFNYSTAIDLLDHLQSQAERIASMQQNMENIYAENKALRAQLATIAATEPVGYIDEMDKPRLTADKRLIALSVAGGCDALFTRPMPAQDVEASMIKLPEPLGYLCDWGDDSYGLPNQIVYYDEPGSAIEDDWNKHPEVHLNTPVYTEAQLKQAVRDALDAQGVTELVEALQLFAYALPLDRSTVKTCYAVTDQMRDAAHAALSKYKGAK